MSWKDRRGVGEEADLGGGEGDPGESVPIRNDRHPLAQVLLDRFTAQSIESIQDQPHPFISFPPVSLREDAGEPQYSRAFPSVGTEQQMNRPIIHLRRVPQIGVDHLSNLCRPV